MPVNLSAPDPAALHAVPGVRIGVAEAGVRKANRKDLTVFLLEAVAGEALLARSYAAALEHGYLWHEFGDSHLVLP